MLPVQGAIPLAAPISWGCSNRVPWGVGVLTHAGVEFGIQCTRGITLILLGILLGGVKLFILWSLWSSAQQGGAMHEGRLIEVQLFKLLLHKELVSSSSHALPPGWPLGCDWLSLYGWRHCYGIQMSNSLFSSLMSKLPSHLHLVASLLESLLEGYHFYHVAGPGCMPINWWA